MPAMSRLATAAIAAALLTSCAAPCPPPPAAPPAPVCPQTAPAPAPSVAAQPPWELSASVSAGEYVLELRASPFSNLAYQLDCMAELMPCSTQAYRELWKSLPRTDADEANLTAWGILRKQWHADITRRDQSAALLSFPDFRSQVSLEQRQRLASLTAGSAAGYEQAMALLVGEADAALLRRIAEHFAPRFLSWWDKEGKAITGPFLEGTRALLQEQSLGALLAAVGRFYETDEKAAGRVVIHLMARPNLGDGHTSAQQLERHFPTEIVQGEKPEERIDVMAHELFHYFYENMRDASAASLLKRFEASSDPKASIAYSLLNESFAAGWGNGVVGRRMMTPDKFEKLMARPGGLYSDTTVDATAKGLLPYLEASLAIGGTLSSEATYRALLEAVNEAAQEPAAQDYLRDHAAYFTSPEHRPAHRAMRRKLRTGSVWSFQPIDEQARDFAKAYPMVSGVVFASPAELGKLEGLVPKKELGALRKAAGKKPFAFAVQRTASSYWFVLVGSTPAELEALAGSVAGLTKVRPGRLP
jgi:hypothetical protein